MEQDKIMSIIYISLPAVSISIISINNKRPVELNLITLFDVELASSNQNDTKSFQLSVGFLNIDQNQTYNTINPVLLTPQQQRQYLQGNSKTIDIKLEQNKSQDQVMILQHFSMSLAPMTLKIEEEYIQSLLNLVKIFQAESNSDSLIQEDNLLSSYQASQLLFMASQKRLELIRKIQLLVSKGPNQNFLQEWEIINIPNLSKSLYIKSLILPPINVKISYSKSYNSSPDSFFIFQVITNAFGTAISNIEDAPIRLTGFKLENVFDTTQGLMLQLKEHYKDGMIKQFLKIIGSIDIIGNPISLFSRISTGVVDLIEKPIEGISQGPLELGLGILKGATSLIKNTVAGTFYSINRVTGGIATQISMLSMDEEYLQNRKKILQKKPAQLIDGFVYGFTAIAYSTSQGIVGIAKQPYKHFKQDSYIGLIKGFLL